MVDAPVPMMATLRPVRSCAWSHWAEWNAVPANEEAPAISGTWGSESPPPPPTRNSAVNEPCVVAMRQTPSAASHAACLQRRVESNLVPDAVPAHDVV